MDRYESMKLDLLNQYWEGKISKLTMRVKIAMLEEDRERDENKTD